MNKKNLRGIPVRRFYDVFGVGAGPQRIAY